tara:strand:+ start:159 stop:554 length:396 start_codon:yes stop_codon:yes gene_type:complete
MKKVLEKASKIATLSPREISNIRTQISGVMTRLQPDVEAVLTGDKKWSTTQVQLYKLLLNKIVPDIQASYVDSPNGSSLRVSGLSRDELESMVLERSQKTSATNDNSTGNLPISEAVIENGDNFPRQDGDP